MQADCTPGHFTSFTVKVSHNSNYGSYWFNLQCFSFGWDKTSNIWFCNITNVLPNQYFNEGMGNCGNPQTSMAIVKKYQYIDFDWHLIMFKKVFSNTIEI